MLFNSFEFLVFLPVVYGIFSKLTNQKHRLVLFFLASCYFYSFLIPAYLLILFLLIGVDFWAAIRIEESLDQNQKKRFLYLSIVANLGILGFFKYTNFLISNLQDLAQVLHWNLPLKTLEFALPIGLSFHTFQSLSYVFEVYSGRFRAERSLLHYAVYVLYFPQLVAGPIERPQNILPQLHRRYSFNSEQFKSGLKLMTQGLFKKAVVADTLAILANRVFDHPQDFGTIGILAGILSFTFQIYCDFSGYSDLARGVSLLFGIDLMVNFKKPYFAISISDFWRRWHISLSTWFRDYVYIPLGGNRGSTFRTQLNLFLVFLLSGFWHGANWTFLVWGFLHGTYLLVENLILIPMGINRLPKILRQFGVFFWVALAWVFFRAQTIPEALLTLGHLFVTPTAGLDSIPRHEGVEAILSILFLLLFEGLDDRNPIWKRISSFAPIPRRLIYAMMLVLVLISAQFAGKQFIYFQF
jgi:D-alanyl-lipoteichoic acid acyltransferase DltB (MBOAT superfamily)